MEDVARQIYRNHLDVSRRRRGIDKIVPKPINRKVTLSLGKQEYSTGAKTESIRETRATREEEVRYEKRVSKSRVKEEDVERYREEMVKQRQKVRVKKSKSRIVRQKEPKGRGISRFRRAVLAVQFSIRLRRLQSTSLMKHRNWCLKWSGSGLLGIIRGQRDYYEHLLSHELYDYMLILEDSISGRPPSDRVLLELLADLTSKLSTSTITSDMLRLLQATATSRAFVPPDLLSLVEMQRVEVSPRYGCLMGVNRGQTRMLVAMLLGVKIFCYYLLLQPWTLELATVPVVKQRQEMTPVVKKVGLVAYHILFEECCHSLPAKYSQTEATLSKFGVKAILQLNPFDKEPAQATHTHLLSVHSRSTFTAMEEQHPTLVERVKQCLMTWVSRISYATLTQPQNPPVRPSQRPSRRNYRSLDLSTNQTPSPTLTDQSYRLPRIPPPRRHY